MFLKHVIFYALFFFQSVHLFAGFENKDYGSRSLALSGSYVALANSGWTIYSNPAGLTLLSAFETGLFYQEPFGLQELKNIGVMAAQPFSFGAFGFGLIQYGFELYKESLITGSFAHQITDEFSAGYSLNLHQVSIKNYGQATSWSIDAGMLYFPTEWLNLGFSASNLTQSSIGNAKEVLPVVIRSGVSVTLINDIHVMAEIYKQSGYDADHRFAIDFLIHPNVSIYTGVGSQPNNLSGGFSIYYEQFQIDYAVSHHPDLGISSSFSLSFSLAENIVNRQLYRDDRVSLYDSFLPQKKTAQGKNNPAPTEIKVNINTATVEEFQKIPGIGPALAAEIVKVREIRGGFRIIDELLGVKGMSDAKFAQIRSSLYIE